MVGKDSLMIVHESEKVKLTKALFERLRWKTWSSYVGVDGGTFSFYDSAIIRKINGITDAKITAKKSSSIEKVDKPCKIRIPRKHYIESRLPIIKYQNKQAFMITTKMLADVSPNEMPKELHNLKFGACSSTGTGDGAFNVYVHGKTMALLVGGLYDEILHPYKGGDSE